MRRLTGPLLALLLGTASADAAACAWDIDTVAMERQQWPGTAEMIVGKFLRHSDAMYEWRVEDRRARLLDYPDRLPLLDDLGVALDKLGRHAEAIEVGEHALGLDPNRYESLANLGTYHAHAGELQIALTLIERAIEVNPDAHFGREKYQALLITHLLEGESPHTTRDFAATVLREYDGHDELAELERARAGVEGMMRFGKHDSPLLLDALGSILATERHHSGSRRNPGQLAAYAFTMAAMRHADEEAAASSRGEAARALELEGSTDLPQVEYEVRWDQADADAWFAQITRDEIAWIADAQTNPDAAFDAKYYVDPSVVRRETPKAPEPGPPGRDWTWLLWIPAGGAVLTVVLGRHHAMS